MKYPKSIYVYVCDYDKTEPIFALSTELDDISEEVHGDEVARYTLDSTDKFQVTKRLGGSVK